MSVDPKADGASARQKKAEAQEEERAAEARGTLLRLQIPPHERKDCV
jgi:hypothetical protein